ncbi:PTS system mannose/fructose/sorbose family transporter subunit IID [[Lactobacillus] timonensis]|jgi:PTS system mannose-specific IID component|uniref:PTS system mannose/fructose/sorbose family transporter subunit IID n=1 Tax=[Lactobacillus] timonensis TaxID=1970790 RepID=UPI000C8588A6|nr:PTS system mannose/fructose/sorbose family transporter subunit IID [[Lactobacillus] timonensis]
MSEQEQTNKPNDGQLQLTRHDLTASFWRSGFLQGSWNYERVQNIGFCFQMEPTIKRLYGGDKKETAKAMKRHLTFMQTTPVMSSLIGGVMMAMEQQRANGEDVEDTMIQSLKVAMMGPLAGVGDPIYWATIRPVLGAFAASLALSGMGVVGPLVFFVVWNAIRLASRWYFQKLGYEQGLNVMHDLSGNLLQKFTLGASILGMFILGALVPRWTKVNMPLVISKVTANGHTTVTTLQDIFDQLMPGLAPLLLTFFCIWLLRKKVNAVWIIFILFALGIVGYMFHIFG